MENINNFIEIKKTKKIWAIGSIHSRLKSFESLKQFILDKFEKEDHLIFLGNIIGLGVESKNTLNSVIDLRNKLMSKFLLNPNKIIFLRGAQEEMFLKLLLFPLNIMQVWPSLLRQQLAGLARNDQNAWYTGPYLGSSIGAC